MILMSLEDFAAKRRKKQSDIEKILRPYAREAVSDLGDGIEAWNASLMQKVLDLWVENYREEGATRPAVRAYRKFRDSLREAFDKTTPDSHPDTIAVWLATALLNSSAAAAAEADEEFVVLEWVTMHDSDVRASHREVDGQRRAPGDTFTVSGEELLYPGQPVGDPAVWINCRCALRPALPEDNFAQENDMAEQSETSNVQWYGVLAPEGKWSGDGRMFAEESLSTRDLPLPLTWQKASGSGHDGSVTVARIDEIARVNGEMRGRGEFLTSPEAKEAMGLVAEFGRYGVSIDADSAVAEPSADDQGIVFTSARIASASIVSIPAFAEAYVALGEAPAGFMTGEDEQGSVTELASISEEPWDGSASRFTPEQWAKSCILHVCDGEEKSCHKLPIHEPGGALSRAGVHAAAARISQVDAPPAAIAKAKTALRGAYDTLGEEVPDSLAASGAYAPAVSLVAAGSCAPSEWFENPKFDRLTPFTVEDERVFGHLAGWGVCHTGFKDMCVEAPRSETNYSYFLTGEVVTDKGRVPVGNVTIGGGHAGPRLGARAAAAHYDSTSSVVADVTVGEDEFGIWMAGRLRPGVPDDMVDALRASALSGDWRRHPGTGSLELIAALAVNVPGFPIPRVAAGVENAVQMSLVAAGIIEKGEKEDDGIRLLAAAVLREINEQKVRKEKMAALAAKIEGSN